jgi:hypothetical protein
MINYNKMENKNITNNLIIKQINQSNSIAYNKEYLSDSSDYEYNILENAYKGTSKIYAELKMAIKNNKCTTGNCFEENEALKKLQEAPQVSVEFIQNLMGELSNTDLPNFDVNSNYKYTVANSIMNGKPGFSKTDGYEVNLYLNTDGTQTIVFSGPMFVKEGFDEFGMPATVIDSLVINSSALESLLESETSLVAVTPDVNKEMLELLANVGIFAQADILENGALAPNAKITEEFVMKNPDGSFDYEIIDIGGGKGRNVLKYDMDKIRKKVDPFINAEVAGLLSSEQEAVAAWNVYISRGISVEEDDQMVQNANAGSMSWSYETDLPLSQDKKVLFESKYKDYFMNNYLKQFLTNQFPTVEQDAAVFDLAEAKKAKAQKFIDDNNL